jgi:hypothetical protein
MKTFEEVKNAINEGTIKAPNVMYGGNEIPYTSYQLAMAKFNLGILSSGMLMRGVKLKDLKSYFGLKGRSARDCYEEFCIKYYN